MNLLKEAGYEDLKDVIADNRTLKAGDKVYAVNMNKALVAFNIGEEPEKIYETANKLLAKIK